MKRSVDMTIDIGSDLDHYISLTGAKEKIIKIDRNIATGIQNGMIEDTDTLMSCISLFKDMTCLSNSGLTTLLGNTTLRIISRGQLTKIRRDMVLSHARQLLFDKCTFTTHAELVRSNVLTGLKNAICLRIYKAEVLVDIANVEVSEKLRFSPDIMVYSLRRFLESKYSVVLDDIEVEKLLVQHFQVDPKSIGKRVVKYRIATAGNQQIVANFHEVAEALRPISKSLIECIMPHIKKPNDTPIVTYFYTEIDWVRAFFGCGIRMYMTMPHEFVDIATGSPHMHLDFGNVTLVTRHCEEVRQ